MDPLLPLVFIIIGVLTIVVGSIGGFLLGSRRGRSALLADQEEAILTRRKLAEEESVRIITEADARAKQLEIKARDEALRLTNESEDNIKKRRLEVDREAERLDKRREELDRRLERVDNRERDLNKRQSSLDKRKSELDKMLDDRKLELERVAQMTREEAPGTAAGRGAGRAR
jgi:ribonuclease Y